MNARLIEDVCDQVGIHRHAFRVLFPTDDSLLDAVNQMLVQECADRLRACVVDFVPTGANMFAEAATALAGSWPLDRTGIIIRAERRVRALRSTAGGDQVAIAERRFVVALAQTLTDLMNKLGRRFSWSPSLAVRIILDTYERSFEAWLLDGRSELEFPESPYVSRTLPTLLRELSEPNGREPLSGGGDKVGQRQSANANARLYAVNDGELAFRG